ncbi:MAG: SDR family oxidoreductase [Ilumatobacteraceae bacterium]
MHSSRSSMRCGPRIPGRDPVRRCDRPRDGRSPSAWHRPGDSPAPRSRRCGLGPLVGLPAGEFRRVFDVNVTGTWLVSKACASRMLAANVPGRICNVSSQAGKKAWPMIGTYSAAKAAVISLTQAMAIELGPSGIAVNAVCPGTVDTDLTNPNGMFVTMIGGEEGLDAYLAREIPLRRLQTADEIASAICWLLSDDATGVTGEAMNVSAGQTMV